MRRFLTLASTYLQGLCECCGDAGMTWETDWTRSDAYDAGRLLGHRLLRIR